MIERSNPWHTRSILSKSAHVLERLGLALTGASSGLFVAAVAAVIAPIGSAEAALAMMLYGATAFYLGIDLPQVPSDRRIHMPLRFGLGNVGDMLELLTATGIFLTAVTAVVSVSIIILGESVGASTAGIIFVSWVIGATLQMTAGVIARAKLARAVKTATFALFFR